MNWEYLAGWFDADGSVAITKQQTQYKRLDGTVSTKIYHNVRILLQNTDKNVIRSFREFLGLQRLKIGQIQPTTLGKKTLYCLQITKKAEVDMILAEMLSRCITKRERVLSAIDFRRKQDNSKRRKRRSKKRPVDYDRLRRVLYV